MDFGEEDRQTRKKRSLANLRPAKPGEVRNPKGHNVAKDIRELDRDMNDDVKRILHKLLRFTGSELDLVLSNPQISNYERMLAVMIKATIDGADVNRASFLLDRAGCRLPPLKPSPAIGKLSEISNDDLIELGKQAMQVILESNPDMSED